MPTPADDAASPPTADTVTNSAAYARMPAVAALAWSRLSGAPGAPRIGRLELVAHIGSGGMGEVYVAHDPELDRRVAVKIVRSDIDSGRHDVSARIVREAQMMARVTHPNVVRVYDVGRIDTRVYITMEYVEGTTLRGWLDRGPQPWREVVELFVRAGRGLAAAHRTGLVHRDFKPANVLVGADGRILVADFGLARALDNEADASTPSGSRRTLASSLSPGLVTAHGTILGTPGYMAPEQLRAGPVDARSDLFSFCVALFEALHGARPFAGLSARVLLANIEARTISPPTTRRRIPARIDRALLRGLAADPAHRFQTMDELLAQLERSLRRPGRVLAPVLAASALLAGTAAADLGPFADDPPCASAGSELATIWNDERRESIKTRFAATHLDFADAAWSRASAQLDAYTAEWSEARQGACEAAELRHEQSPRLFDLRVACLDRRRRPLVALIETFAAADRTTVEQAVDAVAALPAISPCNDPTWLTRSVLPPETDPLATAVAAVRARIARGDALHATGHYRDGREQAALALAAAATLDYEPVRAEALALQGRLLAQLGDLPGAESTLLAAVDLAEAHHHDDLGADIWLDLVHLANRHLIDPTRGAAWISRARASQRRIGDPPARRLAVLNEAGYVLALAHDNDAAIATFRDALALHAEVDGHPRDLAKLTHNLANALEAAERPQEARSTHERSVAATAAAYGPDHPEYAAAILDSAMLRITLGELDAAEAQLLRAREIYDRTLGATHHLVGRVHIALTEVSLRREQFSAALTHAETAARIYRAALADENPARVHAEVALGTAHFYAGRPEAALDAFLSARALQRRAPSPDPIAAAVTACDIAETLVALTRHDEALTHFAEVERLLADAPGRDRDLEARMLTGRGQIALAAGDAPRALTQLEAALELRRQLPADPLALAELNAAIARARAP